MLKTLTQVNIINKVFLLDAKLANLATQIYWNFLSRNLDKQKVANYIRLAYDAFGNEKVSNVTVGNICNGYLSVRLDLYELYLKNGEDVVMKFTNQYSISLRDANKYNEIANYL
jgi:hypothetical protein